MFYFAHLVPLRRRSSAGFTLTELLVVIALIAVLSALLLGGGRYAVERGRVSRAQAELMAWSVALADYRATQGDYPLALEQIKPAPAALLDPWEHPYRYAYRTQQPWTNPGYVLYSAGPDGVAEATLRAGGFANPTAAANRDNLSANPP